MAEIRLMSGCWLSAKCGPSQLYRCKKAATQSRTGLSFRKACIDPRADSSARDSALLLVLGMYASWCATRVGCRLSNPCHTGRVHCAVAGALSGCVAPVTRPGHLQHPADGHDSVVITAAGELRLEENALAVFRMSLARRNSLTSGSSSLMRWASAVTVPGRWALSTSALLTQSCKVCGTQLIWELSTQD